MNFDFWYLCKILHRKIQIPKWNKYQIWYLGLIFCKSCRFQHLFFCWKELRGFSSHIFPPFSSFHYQHYPSHLMRQIHLPNLRLLLTEAVKSPKLELASNPKDFTDWTPRNPLDHSIQAPNRMTIPWHRLLHIVSHHRPRQEVLSVIRANFIL